MVKVLQKEKKRNFHVFQWENQVLIKFFVDLSARSAPLRHNPRSDFRKNGLKMSARLKAKKSQSFSAKKCRFAEI